MDETQDEAIDTSYSMTEAEIKEAQDVMEREGVMGLEEHMRSKLNAWKSVPLNIGVTGACGTGKSTFINTMRGLEPTMTGSAAVGVNETTSKVKAYPDPRNENFVLSDLPGIGTPNFPQKDYLKKVGFEKFDFFLIICSNRFTENDLLLAKQIKEQGKTFYFIRSKIDFDIFNEREDHPCPTNEEEEEQEKALLKRVKSNCQAQLQNLATENSVFLISGKLKM